MILKGISVLEQGIIKMHKSNIFVARAIQESQFYLQNRRERAILYAAAFLGIEPTDTAITTFPNITKKIVSQL